MFSSASSALGKIGARNPVADFNAGQLQSTSSSRRALSACSCSSVANRLRRLESFADMVYMHSVCICCEADNRCQKYIDDAKGQVDTSGEKHGVGSLKGPKSACRSSPALLGILSADLKQADAIDVSSPLCNRVAQTWGSARAQTTKAIRCLCTPGAQIRI